MALLPKTIEFATTTDIATLAAATSRDKTLSVYIPESSITFLSVTLQCWVRDSATASATMTSPVLGIATTVGGTYNEVTLSNPPSNSGEGQVYFFERDVTSWMTSNWSGTTMDLGVRFRCAALITANHYFRLVIDYQYSDASTTQIKTVRIPIESTRQYATTSWQTLGGATAIPALTGGYFPENDVVIRQAFLDLWGNESASTVGTDFNLSIRVNGGTTRGVYFSEQAFGGNNLHFRLGYDITTEDTYGSARSLEILSDVNDRYARVGGMLVVTYEYNHSTTTRFRNSLFLGGIDTAGQIPGTTAGDADSWGRDIYIVEPGTITMHESAVCLFAQSSAPNTQTLNVAVGAQGTYTGYSMSKNGSFELGPHSLVHRIDAGGQNGTAFATLARGINSYELRVYASGTNNWWNLCGFLILNYDSDVAPGGVGTHNKSRYNLLAGKTSGSAVSRTVTTPGLLLGADETNYWLTGAMTEINLDHGGTVSGYSYVLNVERGSGEGEGEGWEPIFVGMTLADTERNSGIRIYSAARSAFRRFPADPDTSRMDLEASRSWRLDTPSSCYSSLGIWATYHTMTFTISGTLTEYTGDGSGIEVDIFRKIGTRREHIGTATTTTGGAYTFTWYNDTDTVFATAAQSASLTGRSADGTAT